jgi:hypothetical protein
MAKESTGHGFRRARFKHMRALINACVAETGGCRILDIGGTSRYWRTVLAPEDANVPFEVVLLNIKLNDDPLLDGRFTRAAGDARKMDYADGAFDIAHSNSVIEHVGSWEDMASMASEVRRIARRYFVQTPNFWFPIEPHFRTAFFHWLPEQVRMRLIMRRRLGFISQADNADKAMRTIQSCALLDGRQMRALFPDAELVAERFAGFTKSWVAIRR